MRSLSEEGCDMATDHTRAKRLQIMLSAEELSAIDDWRF
jgi:hypothetical protein